MFFVDIVGDRDILCYGGSLFFLVFKYYCDGGKCFCYLVLLCRLMRIVGNCIIGYNDGFWIVYFRDWIEKGIEVVLKGWLYVSWYFIVNLVLFNEI